MWDMKDYKEVLGGNWSYYANRCGVFFKRIKPEQQRMYSLLIQFTSRTFGKKYRLFSILCDIIPIDILFILPIDVSVSWLFYVYFQVLH